jgi:hypothetical protein
LGIELLSEAFRRADGSTEKMKKLYSAQIVNVKAVKGKVRILQVPVIEEFQAFGTKSLLYPKPKSHNTSPRQLLTTLAVVGDKDPYSQNSGVPMLVSACYCQC